MSSGTSPTKQNHGALIAAPDLSDLRNELVLYSETLTQKLTYLDETNDLLFAEQKPVDPRLKNYLVPDATRTAKLVLTYRPQETDVLLNSYARVRKVWGSWNEWLEPIPLEVGTGELPSATIWIEPHTVILFAFSSEEGTSFLSTAHQTVSTAEPRSLWNAAFAERPTICSQNGFDQTAPLKSVDAPTEALLDAPTEVLERIFGCLSTGEAFALASSCRTVFDRVERCLLKKMCQHSTSAGSMVLAGRYESDPGSKWSQDVGPGRLGYKIVRAQTKIEGDAATTRAPHSTVWALLTLWIPEGTNLAADQDKDKDRQVPNVKYAAGEVRVLGSQLFGSDRDLVWSAFMAQDRNMLSLQSAFGGTYEWTVGETHTLADPNVRVCGNGLHYFTDAESALRYANLMSPHLYITRRIHHVRTTSTSTTTLAEPKISEVAYGKQAEDAMLSTVSSSSSGWKAPCNYL